MSLEALLLLGDDVIYSVSPGLSVEGYVDVERGGVKDYYGSNLKGVGFNAGVGTGWFGYMGYTIVANFDWNKLFPVSTLHVK